MTRRQDDRLISVETDIRIIDPGQTERWGESTLPGGTIEHLKEEMGLKCEP